MARRDDREPGPPPRVVCAVGWQYREYLREEQRRQARGPQRGSRVGVEEGCSATRMQMELHHGLLAARRGIGRLCAFGASASLAERRPSIPRAQAERAALRSIPHGARTGLRDPPAAAARRHPLVPRAVVDNRACLSSARPLPNLVRGGWVDRRDRMLRLRPKGLVMAVGTLASFRLFSLGMGGGVK